MVWHKAKHLLAFSLTLFRYTQAANNCNSSLLTCFSFEVGNTVDFELLYDEIPPGSVDSICSNLQKAFPKSKLGMPGCQTFKGTSNLVVLSTRISGTSPSSAFSNIQDKFETVLDCTNNHEFGSCVEMHQQQPAPSGGTFIWMSNIQNSLEVSGGSLTMISLGIANSALPFQNTHDVAAALFEISSSIVQTLADARNTILIFEATIRNTSLKVVINLDFGIGKSFKKTNAARLTSSDWLVPLQGLVSAADAAQTSVIGGGYSFGNPKNVDLLIGLAIVAQT